VTATGSPALPVPLVDVLAGREPDVLVLPHVVVDRFEVLDPVGYTRDVEVDGEGYEAGLASAFRVEPVELIAAALGPCVRGGA